MLQIKNYDPVDKDLNLRNEDEGFKSLHLQPRII